MLRQSNWTYFSTIALAVAFTWVTHEMAHWLAGEILGYEMKLTLNTVSLVTGEYQNSLHQLLVRIAGPAVTLLQGGVAFFLLRKRFRLWVFPLLFTPFYMRALAAAMNVINLNDEGAISNALGLGTFTIPVVVSLLLLTPVVYISKKYQLSRALVGKTLLGVMLFSSILILADQFLHLRIL